jgi:large subunit ribosomal protein L24
MHVKKGDKVKIIAGKDKGKSGVILRALPKEDKVIVEGVALYKKHMKGRSVGEAGRIIEKSRPVHVSNVVRLEK